jgi:hypothetical protein
LTNLYITNIDKYHGIRGSRVALTPIGARLLAISQEITAKMCFQLLRMRLEYPYSYVG